MIVYLKCKSKTHQQKIPVNNKEGSEEVPIFFSLSFSRKAPSEMNTLQLMFLLSIQKKHSSYKTPCFSYHNTLKLSVFYIYSCIFI